VDWGIIAQATFFVSIGLLAIVITVYVSSTSLLGLAVERTSRELQERKEGQKESTNSRLQAVRKSLNQAQQDNIGEEVQRLRKSLAELEQKLRKDEKDLADIPKKYTLPFAVRGGVVYPGLGFLSAAIFSGVAWSLANNTTPVLHVLWGLGVASIIYGL
jgi:Flp pilus assembly protein TadB